MKTTRTFAYSVFAVVALAMTPSTANGAPGDLFASINGCPANGVGAIYQYAPTGVQSTFASELSRPRGLAFDSLGNLFVATTFCDATCRPTLLKFTPDGAQDVFGNLPDSFFAQSVAIDRSDNVFVMLQSRNFVQSMIYKFTPGGHGTPFGFLIPGRGSQGFSMAFDRAGNLFAADVVAQTIYEFAPDGTRSIFGGPDAFGDFGPIGLAFDASDNLYVSASVFPNDNEAILKFPPSGVKTTFATGLSSVRGLAVDSTGNLFVAESPFFATGDILRFAPDGTKAVFAFGIGCQEGFGGPQYLTIQR
jgi:sugar lactone lactonase YvrE